MRQDNGMWCVRDGPSALASTPSAARTPILERMDDTGYEVL